MTGVQTCALPIFALVAKIIGDHGGVIECESQPRRTVFRILLPVAANADAETKNSETIHA